MMLYVFEYLDNYSVSKNYSSVLLYRTSYWYQLYLALIEFRILKYNLFRIKQTVEYEDIWSKNLVE